MLSDLEIAQAASLKPVKEIAESVGLTEDDLEYYGFASTTVIRHPHPAPNHLLSLGVKWSTLF